jgi:hypothetical protein
VSGAGVYRDTVVADGAADFRLAGFFALAAAFFFGAALFAPLFFARLFMDANPTPRIGGPSTAGPFLDTRPAAHLE